MALTWLKISLFGSKCVVISIRSLAHFVLVFCQICPEKGKIKISAQNIDQLPFLPFSVNSTSYFSHKFPGNIDWIIVILDSTETWVARLLIDFYRKLLTNPTEWGPPSWWAAWISQLHSIRLCSLRCSWNFLSVNAHVVALLFLVVLWQMRLTRLRPSARICT